MKKSLKKSGPNLVQPSEVDALAVCSMKEGKEQSGTKDELIISLTSMLISLSREVLSPDKWMMAKGNAARIAKEYGVDEKKFLDLLEEAFQKFEVIRRSNPLSGMF